MMGSWRGRGDEVKADLPLMMTVRRRMTMTMRIMRTMRTRRMMRMMMMMMKQWDGAGADGTAGQPR